MKNFLLCLTFVLLCPTVCLGVEIDFSSGGYSLKKEERNGKEKYERRSSDEIYSKKQKAKEKAERLMNESTYKPGLPPAWKKIVIYNGGVVTNDFINTTSNRLVITVINYAKAKQDGIEDLKSISDKYLLNFMLLPGDKYHLMNDGGNGIRMEKYLQAHKYCDEMTSENSNYKNLYKEKNVLSTYENYTVTNITIKSDEGDKHLTVVPLSDYDEDGITSGSEITGKNGFVTDPTDFDTDHDGIPDKFDKNPLVKCKSGDPSVMPIEWCEYRSKGKKGKIDLLLPANGDPDNDGIINEYEKMFYTDPLEENGNVICFPKNIVLTHYEEDIYKGSFSVYINYDKPVTLIVRSFDRNYDIPPDIPSISYVSSTPLGWKPSPLKKLFHKRMIPTKFYRIVADVQPRTLHTFTVTDKGHKIKFSRNIVVLAYSDERDEKNGYDNTWIGQNWIEAKRLEDYSPWSDSNYWPEPPESAFPKSDYVYKDFSKIEFKHEPFSNKHKGWHSKGPGILGIKACTPENIHTYDIIIEYREEPFFKYDFDYNKCKTYICTHYYYDPYFRVHCIDSKYFPVFKEERVDEKSPFVFKGKTARKIKEELNQRLGKEVEIIEEGD